MDSVASVLVRGFTLPIVGLVLIPHAILNAAIGGRPSLFVVILVFFTVDFVEWDVPKWAIYGAAALLLTSNFFMRLMWAMLRVYDAKGLVLAPLMDERTMDGYWREQSDNVLYAVVKAKIANSRDLLERS